MSFNGCRVILCLWRSTFIAFGRKWHRRLDQNWFARKRGDSDIVRRRWLHETFSLLFTADFLREFPWVLQTFHPKKPTSTSDLRRRCAKWTTSWDVIGPSFRRTPGSWSSRPTAGAGLDSQMSLLYQQDIWLWVKNPGTLVNAQKVFKIDYNRVVTNPKSLKGTWGFDAQPSLLLYLMWCHGYK